jgi:hypothetical protein
MITPTTTYVLEDGCTNIINSSKSVNINNTKNIEAPLA